MGAFTCIKLKAIDQRLIIVQQPVIASGDIRTVKAEYELDSGWDGYALSGTFYNGKRPEESYEQPLSGGACEIPWEVLQEEGVLYIGLRGVDDDGRVKTAAAVRYRIEKGSPRGADTTTEPTPDVYQRILEAVGNAEAAAQSVRADADAGEFDGVSVTHRWIGTTLEVTSASGTSSADLKGQDANIDPDAYKAEILKAVYPVGAIYISYNSTSPASLFGGTWTQIQGRFLLAADSTYSAGSTGGEATHTLTVDELPAHQHTADFWSNAAGDQGYQGTPATNYACWNRPTERATGVVGSTGGGKAHNNMPPYLAVYMWRRTA